MKGTNKRILALCAACWLFDPLLLSAASAAPPKDQTITDWVRVALREDPRVDPQHIKVDTEMGIVKLTGQIDNLAAREYAKREAMKINGVRGVLDELTVTPAVRPDSEIAEDIRLRLSSSALIEPQNIDVRVMSGKATLKGTVHSSTERQQAGVLAREVRGVRALRNDLTVTYPAGRTDDVIWKDVTATIDRDVYLVGLPITVSVNDGVVTLEGSVGNMYEKQRADDDVYLVDNVKAVRNDIKVEWWETRDARKRLSEPTNGQIESAVFDELCQDMRIKDPFDIRVHASYGHVMLEGSVSSAYDRHRAEEDAQDVVGVAWVTNRLAVKPTTRDDSAILRDVKKRIASDYLLSGEDIAAQVSEGVVTLTGKVDSAYDLAHARALLSSVRGVSRVVNKIQIEWPQRFADTELKQRIEGRLASNWQTHLAADRIKVMVQDGAATLTGDVDTWAQRREAARLALLTNGVCAVDNRITVSGTNYPWDQWDYSTNRTPG
jgi:osmotically-inducible protein OsmY